MRTRRSPFVESSSSTTLQSAASAQDGRTRRTKRKASPDKNTLRKRPRLTESEAQNTSDDNLFVKILRRKVRGCGEGPSKEKTRRRFDLSLDDNESASSSAHTGGESSSNLLDSCNTSAEDVGKRSGKRKAPAGGEGPRKKRKRSLDPKETKQKNKQKTKPDLSVDALRAEFEAKYEQQNQLGEGGCGSVFAGLRRADNLPVAIKHITKDKVFCKQTDKNGKQVSVEVAIMLKLAAGTESMGLSAPISLLDWYDLDQELILVLERPIPAVDLYKYIEVNGGSLQEEDAKIIMKQLVDAAKELLDKRIFHRDIKVENILIETSSNVPRVRLIDFGLGCFFKKGSFYRVFYGTSAHSPPGWHSHYTYRAVPTTVWQLGVVLFESLHKSAPFRTTRFLKNKLGINSNLSEDCRDFLQMCLAKAPEQRPTLEQLQHHPWLR